MSLGSGWISQIHKKYTDHVVWPLIVSEWFKSCYRLLRANNGFFQIIASYYDVFTALLDDLLRVIIDNCDIHTDKSMSLHVNGKHSH